VETVKLPDTLIRLVAFQRNKTGIGMHYPHGAIPLPTCANGPEILTEP